MKVVISGTALLKLVSSAQRALPEMIEGKLLGIDDGKGVIEVSDCFSLPNRAQNNKQTSTQMEEEDAEKQNEENQIEAGVFLK